MGAKLVPAQRTKYTQQDMIKAFVVAWHKEFGEFPKKESIGVLYAQNALETGGTVSMWNNNVGNVKFVAKSDPTLDEGKEYTMLSNVWEIIGGKKVIFNPPHTATWFRSFPTLADGIADHLVFLKTKRYKTAWSAVESGNPAAFAHLLKINLYYTAPEADYVKLMNFYFAKYMKDDTFEKTVKELTVTPVVPTEPPKDTFFDRFKKILG